MKPELANVKALTFDVFGTVVDWRGSIAREVRAMAGEKKLRINAVKFADAWRSGYRPAMNRVGSGELPWTKIDDLHRIGEARVSFHSAGHVLGSAQIRLEAGGESWLVSGDYKRCADPSCTPYEPVQADVLISEATFGLPIYRWQSGAAVAEEIVQWWRSVPDRPSVLFCYAFGKAQRVLAELHRLGIGDEVTVKVGARYSDANSMVESGESALCIQPVSEILNMPGVPKTPSSGTGIIDASVSGNGARALQFGLRLTW